LARLCRLAGCRALYSLKALGLPDVLHLMVPQLAGFSASSLFEARLVRHVVGPQFEVQVTSPGLRDRDCAELARYCDAISFNSLSQSTRLGGYFSHMRTGLRINPQISQIDDERFDPCRKHSKLGEPASNLRTLKALPPGISGIHFHNNCESDDFSGLKPTIERLQCEIPHILAQISWINLGGGYGWCAPHAVGQLIEATALLRSTAIQNIYIEPGAALVRDGGIFVASVVDLIDSDGQTVAVLDTSVNHMPEVFEYSDLPGFEPEVLGHRDDLTTGEGFGYILAGSTCLAGDRFGTYQFAEPLTIGSRVVFPAMGAYSLVKAHMFNGQPLPNIYLEMGDGSVMLRRASSFADFAGINHRPAFCQVATARKAQSMRLYEEQIRISLPTQSDRLLAHVAAYLRENLPTDAMPLRFAATRTCEDHIDCEVGVLTGLVHDHPARLRSIMDFRRRTHESCDRFTTVLVVPTGIDADIGGHAGDAGPVARLLAAASDLLITHPNVVNGADINEMPENTLYVEGSVLTRLMMGTAGLAPVRANRVLPLIQEHPQSEIWHTLVNAVSAAYGAGGFPCRPVVPLPVHLVMTPHISPTSGRATGVIEGFDALCEVIEKRLGTFDAIAISSVVDVKEDVQRAYFMGNEGINPFGGIEALLTHAVSLLYDMPAAHAPMYDTFEIMTGDEGIYEPRKAAEGSSFACIHSIIKGLSRSPRIVTGAPALAGRGVVSAEDVSCLVIPDGCLGLPTLAALHQGIHIIAVRENRNLMRNDLARLFGSTGCYHHVENYWEAAGLIMALKAGIAPETARRDANGKLASIAEGLSRLKPGSPAAAASLRLVK
jgi:carboxynorspermidine decarboxylase